MSTIPEQGVINLGPDQPVAFGMEGTRAELEGVMARSIQAARLEWEKECRDAYELGLFDIGVDQWIAQRLVQELTKWQQPRPIQPKITRMTLDQVIEDVHYVAQNYNDERYGLPMYSDTMYEFRKLLNERLQLGIDL